MFLGINSFNTNTVSWSVVLYALLYKFFSRWKALTLLTSFKLSQWYWIFDWHLIKQYLQYSSRKISSDSSPNISTLWECISLMIPKSGLWPSIRIVPLELIKIHVPPDVVADLLSSDDMIVSCLVWINSINDSFVSISFTLWMRIRFQSGRLLTCRFNDIGTFVGTISMSCRG